MEYIIKYFLSPVKVKLPNTLISTSKNDSSMHMAKPKLNVSENMPRILQKLFLKTLHIQKQVFRCLL